MDSLSTTPTSAQLSATPCKGRSGLVRKRITVFLDDDDQQAFDASAESLRSPSSMIGAGILNHHGKLSDSLSPSSFLLTPAKGSDGCTPQQRSYSPQMGNTFGLTLGEREAIAASSADAYYASMGFGNHSEHDVTPRREESARGEEGAKGEGEGPNEAPSRADHLRSVSSSSARGSLTASNASSINGSRQRVHDQPASETGEASAPLGDGAANASINLGRGLVLGSLLSSSSVSNNQNKLPMLLGGSTLLNNSANTLNTITSIGTGRPLSSLGSFGVSHWTSAPQANGAPHRAELSPPDATDHAGRSSSSLSTRSNGHILGVSRTSSRLRRGSPAFLPGLSTSPSALSRPQPLGSSGVRLSPLHSVPDANQDDRGPSVGGGSPAVVFGRRSQSDNSPATSNRIGGGMGAVSTAHRVRAVLKNLDEEEDL